MLEAVKKLITPIRSGGLVHCIKTHKIITTLVILLLTYFIANFIYGLFPHKYKLVGDKTYAVFSFNRSFHIYRYSESQLTLGFKYPEMRPLTKSEISVLGIIKNELHVSLQKFDRDDLFKENLTSLYKLKMPKNIVYQDNELEIVSAEFPDGFEIDFDHYLLFKEGKVFGEMACSKKLHGVCKIFTTYKGFMYKLLFEKTDASEWKQYIVSVNNFINDHLVEEGVNHD